MAHTMSELVTQIHTKVAGGSCPIDANLKNEIKWALELAHREVFNGLVYTWMRTVGRFSTIAGTSDYTLPLDFGVLIEPSMEIPAQNQPILGISQQDLDKWQPSLYRGTGRPARYTIPDSYRGTGRYRLVLYPTPDAVYAITYRYFAEPDSIHSMDDDAYFDSRFPPAYFTTIYWGALSNMADYIERDMHTDALLKFRNAKSALRRGNIIIKGDVTQKDKPISATGQWPYVDTSTLLAAPSDIISPY